MRLNLAALALAPLAILALGAPAARAEAGGAIKDVEFGARFDELQKLVDLKNKNQLKTSDIVQRYAQRAAEQGIGERERAMRTYMHAVVARELLEDVTTARRLFEKALDFWSRFPAAHLQLARIAQRADDSRAFEQHLRRALSIDPDYIPALVTLATHALRRRDLDEAERLFKRCTDVDIEVAEALAGLQDVYAARWREASTPEEREEWARKARGAARALVELNPKSLLAHIWRAKCEEDLLAPDRAITSLEESYANAGLEDKARFRILLQLVDLYTSRMDLENLARSIERLLEFEGLAANEREKLKQRLADIREKGRSALVHWEVRYQIDVLQDELAGEQARIAAVRRLLHMFEIPEFRLQENMRPLAKEVFDAVFRTLIDAPAPVVLETLSWLRLSQDNPSLVRILVHFIYPYDDARRGEDVRVAAIRALDAVCGEVALPALLYALSDASGRVAREIDKALSRRCARRSAYGGGIAPLTPEEARASRKQWIEYFHTGEGGTRLARAFRAQADLIAEPGESRGQFSSPMFDHAVTGVLLDGDMPWDAWEAAYAFIVRYYGRDFRPPEERGRPVRASDREGIVKALEEQMRAPRDDAQAVAPGGGAPGKEKK